MQPLRPKKNNATSGGTKKSYNLLGQKNVTSWDKKIKQPLWTKKSHNLSGRKKNVTSQDKKNHATS